jgi:two-component system nitrate/nitrite sensor histidine kinase NarX
MADRVQTVHRTLEDRVSEKTAKLQAQNHEISTLYETAGFLARPNPLKNRVADSCEGYAKD